jgi:hypothetical protein
VVLETKKKKQEKYLLKQKQTIMATATLTSRRFTLNVSDLWKGLIVSVVGSVLAIITDSISQGSLNFDWAVIGKTALATGLSYILKNFLTPTEIVVKDPTDAQIETVKEGGARVIVNN